MFFLRAVVQNPSFLAYRNRPFLFFRKYIPNKTLLYTQNIFLFFLMTHKQPVSYNQHRRFLFHIAYKGR